MQFKKGDGWKACYDEEKGLYTAERGGCGYYRTRSRRMSSTRLLTGCAMTRRTN